LQLHVERNAPESRPLESNVGPFAIREPRDEIARPNVHVPAFGWGVELTDDGLRFRNSLRFEPFALEHVLEIRIAPEIQLIRSVDPNAALAQQVGQDTMNDRGADLALDVVTYDRQFCLLEPLAPSAVGGNEDRNTVHERAARIDSALRVMLSGLFRTDRKIGDDDLRAAL